MFLLGPVLLFAVARTSNGLSKVTETVEGLGEVGAVCDGGEMYVEVDEKAFVGLAAAVTATIDMPEDPDCSPFDHVYLSFEPVGHPPWDGLGNGYVRRAPRGRSLLHRVARV